MKGYYVIVSPDGDENVLRLSPVFTSSKKMHEEIDNHVSRHRRDGGRITYEHVHDNGFVQAIYIRDSHFEFGNENIYVWEER